MNEPEKQPCRRCFVIRFFILGIVMLALIGLLGGDKLVYLRHITPELVASVIMIGGMLGLSASLFSGGFSPKMMKIPTKSLKGGREQSHSHFLSRENRP